MLSRRFAAAAAALIIGCSSTYAQTFSRGEMDPLGRFDFVLAVAEFNGDGRDDILVDERTKSTTSARRQMDD